MKKIGLTLGCILIIAGIIWPFVGLARYQSAVQQNERAFEELRNRPRGWSDYISANNALNRNSLRLYERYDLTLYFNLGLAGAAILSGSVLLILSNNSSPAQKADDEVSEDEK